MLKLIYPSLQSNTKLTTLPTLCITGKLLCRPCGKLCTFTKNSSSLFAIRMDAIDYSGNNTASGYVVRAGQRTCVDVKVLMQIYLKTCQSLPMSEGPADCCLCTIHQM